MVQKPSSSNKNYRTGGVKQKVPLSQPTSKDNKPRYVKLKSHQAWSFSPKISNLAIVLNAILPDYTVEFYSICVKDVRDLITSLIRNHGFTDGPARYNAIKNYTVDLIEGKNPQNPGWLATSDVHRVPSALGIEFQKLVIDFLKTSDAALLPKKYQAIITILNIIRMIDGLSDPNFGSITEKSILIDEVLLKEFETYVSLKLNPFKWDNSLEVNLFRERFHLMKSGPNGKPKIETSIEEAITLLRGRLSGPFQRVCEELNISYLYDYLSVLASQESVKFGSKLETVVANTKLRKLVNIADSGCKTRVVAIPDFWTQLSLMPFRRHVQKVTEVLFGKTDFRKDQDSGVAAMVNFQKRCMAEEYSESHKLDIQYLRFYDISSWTDRFHRDLQKIVVKHLFSPRLAEAWAQLVVHCDWYVPSLDGTLKYSQGQGMGTNGSFDIATLTDHLFINFVYDQHSSIKNIFKGNRCYGKVGDDLWIYDPDRIFEVYYGKINLPINKSKSKEFGKLGSVAEFCSRTYLNGNDCSRISPKIVNKSKDYRYIPLLLSLCAARGIQLDRSSFPQLDNIVKSGSETYFDHLQNWIISYLCLGRVHSGTFQYLDKNYLIKGNWLSAKSIAFLDSADNLVKLSIAHSIMSIVSTDKKVKALVSETLKAKQGLDYDGFKPLTNQKVCNLWNLTDPAQLSAKHIVKTEEVLTPKQIVVMGRYLDQNRLITVNIGDIYSGEFMEAEDILQFSKDFAQIASRSSYDQGILSYDKGRVVTTQYQIIRTIERLNEDLTVLTLASSDEVQIALGCITSMSEMDREWILKFLPKLDFEQRTLTTQSG